MKVHYSPAYNDTGVAYDTTRKADAIFDRLVRCPIENIEWLFPEPVPLDELVAVHRRKYIDALMSGTPSSLAESNGLGWDDRLFAAVSASTGGVRAAVLESLRTGTHSGSLSSGLHHARGERGAGNCTLNGLVVGARAALAAGAARVLIVDFDAHCGGGTASLIEGVSGIEQLDVSVSGYDHYSDHASARLIMSDGRDYVGDLSRALDSVQDPASIDVVLYNAGMDPHHAAGGIRPIDADVLHRREDLVFGWAASHGLPVAWVLAGGYTFGIDMDGLVDLHLLTVRAAASTPAVA